MAFMKFYVGTEASVQEHLDGIYLATDTHKIFYNGSAYGGGDVDLSGYLPLTSSGIIETSIKQLNLNNRIGIGKESGVSENNSLIFSNYDHIGFYGNLPTSFWYIGSNKDYVSGSLDDKYEFSLRNGYREASIDGCPKLVSITGTGIDSRNPSGGKIYVFRLARREPSLATLITGGSLGIVSIDPDNPIISDYPSLDTSKHRILINSNGITIKNKTSSDLLHAAGGTISINELKSQLNIPDTSSLQSAIGNNTYTGANYISKETNLTDAVLQLDEEIKATNDNLALEHTNAEAMYAKKTELGNYLPLTGGNIKPMGTVNWNFNEARDRYTSIDSTGILVFDKLTGIYPSGRIYIGRLSRCKNWDTDEALGIALAELVSNNYTIAISTYGVYLNGKTNQDLLHAAGGTVSINDIISQVTVPTKVSELTNDAGYQTESQVAAKVSALVDSAPETLNTLNELAAALGDDPNFATTITNQIAGKANASHTHKIGEITNLQSTLDGKAASSHTHPVSQITGLTANRALVSDSSGHPAVSAVTSTELGYLDGVTSNVQTQLNGKAASSHTHTASQVSGLSRVATTNSYDDLDDKPSIPSIEILTTVEVQSILNS